MLTRMAYVLAIPVLVLSATQPQAQQPQRSPAQQAKFKACQDEVSKLLTGRRPGPGRKTAGQEYMRACMSR